MNKLRVGLVTLVVTLAVAGGLLLGAVPAMAQEHDAVQPEELPAEVPELEEVAAMLAQGIGLGSVIAFLFEEFDWFQGLSSKGRWWLVLGLSLGLPLLAQLALQFVPAQVWSDLQPYWKALASGFLVWAGGQLAHLVEKRLTAD